MFVSVVLSRKPDPEYTKHVVVQKRTTTSASTIMPDLYQIVNYSPGRIASGLANSNAKTWDAVVSALPPEKKVQVLVEQIKGICLERETEIVAIASLFLCNQHGFLLGPPGTGKSYLIELLSKNMGGNLFSYQFNEYSKPDEVFGPLNPKRLMEDGIAVRNEQHRIGMSTDSYLDEIFKAPGNVLNSLLAILNERVIYNPDPQKRDFRTCIGSSNEIPSSPSVNALLDRFTWKSWVGYLGEDSFRVLLERKINGFKMPKLVSLSISDRDALKARLSSVKASFDLAEFISALRERLKEAGYKVEPGVLLGDSQQVSDRKWLQIIDFLRAIAIVSGTDINGIIVKKYLPGCLWFKPEQAEEVQAIVNKVAEELIGKDAESLATECCQMRSDYLTNFALVADEKAMDVVRRTGAQVAAKIEGIVAKIEADFPNDLNHKASAKAALDDVIEHLNKLTVHFDNQMNRGFLVTELNQLMSRTQSLTAKEWPTQEAWDKYYEETKMKNVVACDSYIEKIKKNVESPHLSEDYIRESFSLISKYLSEIRPQFVNLLDKEVANA